MATVLSCVMNSAYSAIDLSDIPLFNINNLEFEGGFRLPTASYGDSNITYSEGPLTVGANGDSIFIVGHANQQAIGEFSIPELVKSMDVANFNYAEKIQNFSRVLGRPFGGNSEGHDRIGGLEYINGELVVNTWVYYDGGSSARDTTLVVKDAANLSTSSVAGYHRMSARAHAAGWISPVPSVWQDALGGSYIAGASSGEPIINRLSVGPSAFTFNADVFNTDSLAAQDIALTTLLDFSLQNPVGYESGDLSRYLENGSRDNLLWTHLSRANYGFVVPGTRTYMTLGYSGGMASGVGYKIDQGSGQDCPGYCAYQSSDYSNYYWLWDLSDLIEVKAGRMNAHDVEPYAYGRLADDSYAHNGYNRIIGGAYDYANNRLYLSLERGDASDYGWAPSIVAFSIKTPAPPLAPANVEVREGT